jgi:hypothetical protein
VSITFIIIYFLYGWKQRMVTKEIAELQGKKALPAKR